jgi:hypothetical protein
MKWLITLIALAAFCGIATAASCKVTADDGTSSVVTFDGTVR